VLPNEHIDHLARLVHRPIEIVLVRASKEEHLVHRALRAQGAAVLADLRRE